MLTLEVTLLRFSDEREDEKFQLPPPLNFETEYQYHRHETCAAKDVKFYSLLLKLFHI